MGTQDSNPGPIGRSGCTEAKRVKVRKRSEYPLLTPISMGNQDINLFLPHSLSAGCQSRSNL